MVVLRSNCVMCSIFCIFYDIDQCFGAGRATFKRFKDFFSKKSCFREAFTKLVCILVDILVESHEIPNVRQNAAKKILEARKSQTPFEYVHPQ